MKISFITTILNEEGSISKLLDSLSLQILEPDEIIISDGGSIDQTVNRVLEFQRKTKLKIKLLNTKGNRSVGRNAAIKGSTGDIIVCSDAGCELDKNWIKNITKPFEDLSVDVVAGYYKGVPSNIFEKSLIPYVLVMPDRVNPNNFLPATRSMAFKKSVWKKIEGFDEKLSHNEDYAFAKKLKKNKFNIVFQKSAIVYWYPPRTIKKTFIMFYRFAKGDMEAGIYRPKALLVLARYMLGLLLVFVSIFNHSLFLLALLVLGLLTYITWSILKNYKYVNNKSAFFYLPFFQILSDLAVFSGTLFGILIRVGK